MSVPLAYGVVILVWSTTPLAIQWSADGVSPTAGVMLRMVLAAALAWAIAMILRIRVPWHRSALRQYTWANIGLFVGLYCVYQGAMLIPSGLVSLLFGLSPLASALMARFIFAGAPLRIQQWAAILMGTLGLAVVFSRSAMNDEHLLVGMGLVLVGMLSFSLSGLLMKREPVDAVLHPLAQTTGSLTLAAGLYVVAGFLTGVSFEVPPVRASIAISYLALFGSCLGFICYFHVLKHMSAHSVALVTLITPVLAVALGTTLNAEPLTPELLIGGVMIVIALSLFSRRSRGDKWQPAPILNRQDEHRR